ncbi:AzlD domain-containing protein [Streptomyces sp. NPDC087440]|uniref:AzlD domain-containing protein n=1 Tax=Streptomyces sp. NPDC087440 TaxID=3365790 RepID=UPI00382699E0
MNPTVLWTAVAAVALVSFVCKAAGPAVLAGRELPDRARTVIALLAPVLLAAFVVVEIAGPGWSGLDPAVLAGLAAVIGLRLCRVPLALALVGAVVVTALVRALWG